MSHHKVDMTSHWQLNDARLLLQIVRYIAGLSYLCTYASGSCLL